ncbi:hypothetical protein Bpro_0525 [Polaromonas sp. JS666]|nr:hypothetical protein Bpro_0525 [Polaromonas sp. JS666]
MQPHNRQLGAGDSPDGRHAVAKPLGPVHHNMGNPYQRQTAVAAHQPVRLALQFQLSAFRWTATRFNFQRPESADVNRFCMCVYALNRTLAP